ncbi:MAG: glutathione S-transferase family protein [Hyphomonadaceae bacterium]
MANPVKLYGSSLSGNCLKPKWILDRLGAAYDWIETDAFDGSTRTPQFLALNPAGQVPVAVLADGRIIAQSNAIMLYFAETSDLVPRDAYARAKMYEWLFWEQYSHEPAIAVRIARKYYLGKADDELDPALLTKGNAALARMEQQLRESRFLVGESPTLADIALVAYTRKAHLGGFELGDYPSVRRWVARVEELLGIETALPANA